MPTMRVGDADLYYQDDDFADPWKPHDTVFMLHGYARNSNFFRAWVPWLAREYRVVRMDMRGCGQSQDPGPDFVYTMDGVIRDLLGFLDALKLDRVHYVGESFGGVIGAVAAANHPDRLLSLTLVSTPLQVPDSSPALAASLGYATWKDAFLGLGMRGWWMALRKSTGEFTGDMAREEYFAGEYARTPAHIGAALAVFTKTASLAEVLPRISVPTLMLSPGASLRAPLDEQKRMAASFPNVHQKVYEGANHGMYYLTPDPLARDTLQFLRSVGAPNAGSAG